MDVLRENARRQPGETKQSFCKLLASARPPALAGLSNQLVPPIIHPMKRTRTAGLPTRSRPRAASRIELRRRSPFLQFFLELLLFLRNMHEPSRATVDVRAGVRRSGGKLMLQDRLWLCIFATRGTLRTARPQERRPTTTGSYPNGGPR